MGLKVEAIGELRLQDAKLVVSYWTFGWQAQARLYCSAQLI
jgi:hypothetical protein